MPEWMNVWFGVFPTVQSLGAQVLAAVLVIGSYFLARRVCVRKQTGSPAAAATECIVPDCGACSLGQDPPVAKDTVKLHVARR
jgi:hypothetical protein